MIERAAGCLEKGGICLARSATRIPPRSHRLLQPTFWTHGAGNIELPSWWIAFLQASDTKDVFNEYRTTTPSSFFDFLVPPKTIQYLQKQTNLDTTIFRRQRRIRSNHQRSRAYASQTADALLSDQGEDTLVDESISREEAQSRRLDHILAEDDYQTDHAELWAAYLELRDLSVPLESRQILRLLRALGRSGSKDDQERLLQLFESIPMNERKSIHYSHAISAALNHDKLEAAVRLHAQALSEIRVSIGTSSLLSYAIERELWQVAIETWQTYWNHKEVYFDHSDIWVGVDMISLPELWIRALSAVDFATSMTSLADGGAAAAAREFALQLTYKAFTIRNILDSSVHQTTHVYGLKKALEWRTADRKFYTRLLRPGVVEIQYPNIERHQQLFEKAVHLQAPTLDLFTLAITQALSFGSRQYTTLALRYYQALREHTHLTPTPRLLQKMLSSLCTIHSEAGISLILNDYRYYHPFLPVRVFRQAISEFADQGNRKAVEELLKEFFTHFEEITDSRLGNAILRVCHRRGEVKRAVETFDVLESRYRFKPNFTSYTEVIQTHTRVGDVEGATTWYNRLLDAGFKPGHQALVPLMAMFANRGDLEAVKQLLRQSEIYGIDTSIAMINSLVVARVKNDQLAAAEMLVYDALQTVEKVPPHARTRMWNYLLNAYAMRGDLDKITEVHRKMRANNIPSNATTFAALMHGLSIKRQPAAAYRILTDVMPQIQILPTPLHYAICMSGYLLDKNFPKLFLLYAEMLRLQIKPSVAIHSLLIRAAAAIDSKDSQQSDAGTSTQEYVIARQTFEQALEDLDPMELATTDPIKFVGVHRLDEAFSSSYFSYLIFIHGRQKAMDQVRLLYQRFKTKQRDLHMDLESSPPFQMLSALMVANIRDENFEIVDQCWTMSLAGARRLARRLGAKVTEPGWVLPARRYILNIHFRHYARSLVLRDKYEEIHKIVSYLHECGYELDSKSWNMYVRILIESNQILLGFEYCEKELMDSWEGWEPTNVKYIKKSLRIRQPKRLEPHRRLPTYETLVYLAAAFVDAQSTLSAQGGKSLSEQLYAIAPKTVDAVRNLPRFNDPLQRRLLSRRL